MGGTDLQLLGIKKQGIEIVNRKKCKAKFAQQGSWQAAALGLIIQKNTGWHVAKAKAVKYFLFAKQLSSRG